MPRGCTPSAACGGDCWNDEEHRRAMDWCRYWDALDRNGRAKEYQMMDAYVAEQQEERDRLGFSP